MLFSMQIKMSSKEIETRYDEMIGGIVVSYGFAFNHHHHHLVFFLLNMVNKHLIASHNVSPHTPFLSSRMLLLMMFFNSKSSNARRARVYVQSFLFRV